MPRLLFAVVAGLAFGVVDVLLMIPLALPDKRTAMLGAFLSRFAIGFLIPLVKLPLSPWLVGGLDDWGWRSGCMFYNNAFHDSFNAATLLIGREIVPSAMSSWA